MQAGSWARSKYFWIIKYFWEYSAPRADFAIDRFAYTVQIQLMGNCLSDLAAPARLFAVSRTVEDLGRVAECRDVLYAEKSENHDCEVVWSPQHRKATLAYIAGPGHSKFRNSGLTCTLPLVEFIYNKMSVLYLVTAKFPPVVI